MSREMLNEKTFASPELQPIDLGGGGTTVRPKVMTIRGTVGRAFALLMIAVAAATWGWQNATSIFQTSNAVLFIGFIGLIILSVATARRPQISVVTAPIYALVMGVWAGAISALYEAMYPGIVLQAVFATFAVFLACLVLYVTRIVKVTDRFVFVTAVAGGGIFLMYLASWILSLFGVQLPFINSPSPLGIALSVGICIVAAMFLMVDLRFIEEGAQRQAPSYMSWYSAMGLLATLIWLYLEMLRLIGKIRG
jgi:uncharacterized YccA/Bax inhibitor family protein